MHTYGFHAVAAEWVRRLGASLPMRITASWSGFSDPPNTRMWHDPSCTTCGLPSTFVIPTTPECAVVLEAVKDKPCGGAERAILDRFCARRLSIVWVGAKKRAC